MSVADRPGRAPRASVLSQHPEAIRSRRRRLEGRLAGLGARGDGLSRDPEAVRSRRRRIEGGRGRLEEQGIRDQLAVERQERAELAAARRREKRDGAPDLRRLAIGWLGGTRGVRGIRDIIAQVFRCSLDLTHEVRSDASLEGEEDPDRQRHNMRTPWLVVGRYEPQERIGYVELAQALRAVRGDLFLEEAIGAQRLSQIRIVYSDPRAIRGEADSVVSKIGAWEFIVSDLIAELVGSGSGDEDALAVRYSETVVTRFYVYFSTSIINYESAAAWQRVRLG